MKNIIEIAGRKIGAGQPVFVIAEAGVNHNGDIEMAKELIRAAKRSGADCVKFQTYKSERVVTENAPKAKYQLQVTNPTESQIDMLRKIEMKPEVYPELIELSKKEGIIFLSTPYNFEDVDLLDKLGAGAFKMASIHLVEPHFLQYAAAKGKPLILSTGMATLKETRDAVRVIQKTGNNQLVLLQCTTNYPSSIQDANLRAMHTLQKRFNCLVGYSDHTMTLTCAVVAVGLGASVIERHFTLDKTLPGPDHSSSSNPEELTQLVQQIREAEQCLGTGVKEPVAVELENAVGMRRSIVARTDIPTGTKIKLDHVTYKRPATGLLGNQLKRILGKKAAKDIAENDLITLDMVK